MLAPKLVAEATVTETLGRNIVVAETDTCTRTLSSINGDHQAVDVHIHVQMK